MQERLQSQEGYANSIDDFLEQFETIKKQSSEIESHLDVTQKDLNFMSGVYNNLSKQNDSLKKAQESIDNGIKKAEYDIKSCIEYLSNLQNKINEMDGYIKKSIETERKIDTYEKEQENHSREIKHITNNLESIETSLKHLNSDCERLNHEFYQSQTVLENVKKECISAKNHADQYFLSRENFKEYILDVVSQNLHAVKDGWTGPTYYSIKKKQN